MCGAECGVGIEKLCFGVCFQVLININGGAEGNRTPDLLNAIQALSRLSYGPNVPAENIFRRAQFLPKFLRRLRFS